MRRRIVFFILLAVLIGVTVWITSAKRTPFTYAQVLYYGQEHLKLVLYAELIAMGLGIPLGVLASRPQFKVLTPVIVGGANAGQSIPSLAVIAIMVPLLGFGFTAVVVALFIYGILPIIRNSYAGLGNIQSALIEASRGMGMTRWQILRRMELPLAIPVIVAGIRISTVIAVGTAELAPLAGAVSLGNITINGVLTRDPLMILQGAAPTAFLAIGLGFILERIESWITPRGLKVPAQGR